MKNLAFQVEGSTLILVHNDKDPTDEEWDTYVDAVAKQRPNLHAFRILVLTQGGGPNVRQRQRLNAVLSEAPVPIAVVSTSAIARTIVTILRLRNAEIRAFLPEQLEDALGHLQVPPATRPTIHQMVTSLKRQVHWF